MSHFYLGIDTSNYTTSVALVDENANVVFNRKQLLPVKLGECGLRQSDALFAHTKALPILLDEMKDVLGEGIIKAVGVSQKPRNVEGSYMPCFLAGVSAAHAAASSTHAPLYSFSHQCGHMMAAIYSAKAFHLLDGRPFIAFHLSGGTTEMLSVHYKENAFHCEIICSTADISAGQLLDRVGVEMGLPFPCGSHIEKLAKNCNSPIPKINIRAENGKINLSGYENKIKQIFTQSKDVCYTASYALHTVLSSIISMISSAPSHMKNYPILFSGGVMSCQFLKDRLKNHCDGYFSESIYSSDNAAGIALLCAYSHKN